MRAVLKTGVVTMMILLGSNIFDVQANSNWQGYEEGASQTEVQFQNWIKKFGKSYQTKEEYEFRLAVFTRKLHFIEEFNSRGNETQKLGLNQFSDMTKEEFAQKSKKLPEKNVTKVLMKHNTSKEIGQILPDRIDWYERGYVTPVKKVPANCQGSAFAYQTADAVEVVHFNNTKNLINLSIQQLLACDKGGPYVCEQGGFVYPTFVYVKEKGLESEEDYPASMGFSKCHFEPSKVKVKINEVMDVDANPQSVIHALKFGPVISAVNADSPLFQLYDKGIITNKEECQGEVNFNVLIVGYDSDENQQGYFLVKNVWGTEWGDKGFARISDSEDNVCGIMSAGNIHQIN